MLLKKLELGLETGWGRALTWRPRRARGQAGAQVMLLKNLELGVAGNGARMLVNGSRGVITRLVPKQVPHGPGMPAALHLCVLGSHEGKNPNHNPLPFDEEAVKLRVLRAGVRGVAARQARRCKP